MTWTWARRARVLAGGAVLSAGIAAACLAPATAGGQARPRTEWFAAPGGSASNDGSPQRPLDLASALDGRRIPAGSTVWLTGGTYRGPVTSTLTGTAAAPIVVRGSAGERAIVADDRERADGGTVTVKGAWTVYRDFEVVNTARGRAHSRAFRPMGLEVQAPHTKFVNLTVSESGMGFGFWKESVDAELYGNVIFNSGSENTSADYRHGHGIYTQNDSGTKLIRENILVNQYGFGIHAYPNPGKLVGFRFEGNVVADSGAANTSGTARYNNILVSGYRPYPVDRVELVENFTYLSPRDSLRNAFTDANVCLGCTDSQRLGEVIVRGNYFAGGAPVAVVAGWQRAVVRGNTMIGTDGFAVIRPPSTAALKSWEWDDNEYIGGGAARAPDELFAVDRLALGRARWTETTGFDASSRFSPGRPSGTRVFVRPNEYERGRAHVIVYNWDRAARVAVDLKGVLDRGDRFEVRSAFDYLGAPVATGTFDGAAVAIPMGDLRVAEPVGGRGTPSRTRGEFGVFVVRRTTAVAARAPAPPEPAPAAPPESKAAAGLERYVGQYVSLRPVADIRVFLDGGTLKVEIRNEPGRPVYALVPASANHFRLEGAPEGFYATFRVVGGLIQTLTFDRGAASRVTLVRR